MNEKAISEIEAVCDAIINKKSYMNKLTECVNAINSAIIPIIEENEEGASKIIQVLEDMMYGMTQKDEVFLLDTLRFGVIPLLENNRQ